MDHTIICPHRCHASLLIPVPSRATHVTISLPSHANIHSTIEADNKIASTLSLAEDADVDAEEEVNGEKNNPIFNASNRAFRFLWKSYLKIKKANFPTKTRLLPLDRILTLSEEMYELKWEKENEFETIDREAVDDDLSSVGMDQKFMVTIQSVCFLATNC